MAACVFCDIVQGNLARSIVYEDAETLAFLDLHPVHGGHTLVVPRTHAENVASCPSELAAKLFCVSVHVATGIVRATRAHGFNIWTANGKAAGQEVFHLHLHVLPRFEEDTFGLRFPKGYPKEANRAELDAMADRIKALL